MIVHLQRWSRCLLQEISEQQWKDGNGIQENGEVRTCSTSTNFPLDVDGAAAWSYMVDACQKLSSFVVNVAVMALIITDAEWLSVGQWWMATTND